MGSAVILLSGAFWLVHSPDACSKAGLICFKADALVKKFLPSAEKKLVGNDFAAPAEWNKEKEAGSREPGTSESAGGPGVSRGRGYNNEFGMKVSKKQDNPLGLIGRLADDSEARKGKKEKGNPKNCVKRNGEAYPSCNWYDAKAYCGRLLPSLARLKFFYKRECGAAKKSASCGYIFWASEFKENAQGQQAAYDSAYGIESDEAPLDESQGSYMNFEQGMSGEFRRTYPSINVRCN